MECTHTFQTICFAFYKATMNSVSRSSRGLGHRPFTAVTGVRLPYGTPFLYVARFLASAGIAQLVERYLAKVQVAGSNPVSRSKHTKPYLQGGFLCLLQPFSANVAPLASCSNKAEMVHFSGVCRFFWFEFSGAIDPGHKKV